jgi:hypothetical protein
MVTSKNNKTLFGKRARGPRPYVLFSFIGKSMINCAFSNSLNTHNGHSDWHKLRSLCYKDVYLFSGFTITD